MNKEKRIAIILVISSIILTVIGATFAYWRWEITNAQKTVVDFTVGSGFSCSADGGGSITSREKFLAPAACTNPTYAFQRTVKVNATTGTKPVYLNMWLKVNLIGSELANSDYFNYALTTSDQGCDQGTIVASGTFKGATQNSTFNLLEDKEYLTTTTNDTYYLYVWLDAEETNNNTMNQDFDIELGGECSNHLTTIGDTLKQNAVMDNINSTYVQNTTPGVDFSAISSDTNGKGLYIRSGTENDAFPIYYYRGAVTNNNVLFAGFCWKIVRTTRTGGTKLIYNGAPTGTNSDQCENTTGTATQIGTSIFNNNYTSPADVGYMYGARYTYSSATGTDWYYAPDVTYSNGVYTLTANGSYSVETKSTISSTNLRYQHYTCGSSTDTTCATIRYVYKVSNSTAYYITLSDGKKVENVLLEMLTNSSNTTDSTIKTAIDNWYSTNMTSYTNRLEDTPYCNDRSIYQLGGWDPNGGYTTVDLYFGPNGRTNSTYIPSLTCNTNDSFTVNANNGNGKLTYPVGLITGDEIMLAGGKYKYEASNSFYLYTNVEWWSLSPNSFSEYTAYSFTLHSYGRIWTNDVGRNWQSFKGVRPAVSLKAGTKFEPGGDGTATNPYVVK